MSHIGRLAGVFGQGQTVALLLASELNAYLVSSGGDFGPTNAMALTVYLMAIIGLVIIFVFSTAAINERRCKEFFYYQALRYGVLIDFNNHDKVLFKIKGFAVRSSLLNIGTFTMFFTFLVISLWVVVAAITSEGITLQSGTTLGVITFALVRLYGPYAEFYEIENGLISVSKFIENNPTKARKLLSHMKVQSEAICLNRLSDIWRLQQILKSGGGCLAAKLDEDEFSHFESGFAWNQLKTNDEEGSLPGNDYQNTLHAKLTFDLDEINSEDVAKTAKQEFFVKRVVFFLPRRAISLYKSFTPWTSMLSQLNFVDEFDNKQGRRLRKRKHAVNGFFLLV